MTRLSGFVILTVVLVAYVHALRAGHWPPSHPWSGFTLVTLALGQLFAPEPPAGSPFRWAQIAAAALGCTGALLWLVADFM
ncbi:MAG: hypothetical protein ABIX28_00795 [Vicinamibacterales bacterium]